MGNFSSHYSPDWKIFSYRRRDHLQVLETAKKSGKIGAADKKVIAVTKQNVCLTTKLWWANADH